MTEIPEIIRDGCRFRWAPGVLGIMVREGEEFPDNEEVASASPLPFMILGSINLEDGLPNLALNLADYCLICKRSPDRPTHFFMISREISQRDKFPNWPCPEPVSETEKVA